MAQENGEAEAKEEVKLPCHPCCKSENPCSHHALLRAMIEANDKRTNLDAFSQMIDQLVAEGWDKNSSISGVDSELNFPLLHWAAVLGKYKVLKWMIEAKEFDAMAQVEPQKETFLHRVVQYLPHTRDPQRADQTILNMFDLAADYMTVRDADGDTPIHSLAFGIVSRNKSDIYENIIKGVVCAAYGTKTLLDMQNNHGDTVLHVLAVTDCSYVAIKALLETDITWNIKNLNGETPLDIARVHKCNRIVDLLESKVSGGGRRKPTPRKIPPGASLLGEHATNGIMSTQEVLRHAPDGGVPPVPYEQSQNNQGYAAMINQVVNGMAEENTVRNGQVLTVNNTGALSDMDSDDDDLKNEELERCLALEDKEDVDNDVEEEDYEFEDFDDVNDKDFVGSNSKKKQPKRSSRGVTSQTSRRKKGAKDQQNVVDVGSIISQSEQQIEVERTGDPMRKRTDVNDNDRTTDAHQIKNILSEDSTGEALSKKRKKIGNVLSILRKRVKGMPGEGTATSGERNEMDDDGYEYDYYTEEPNTSTPAQNTDNNTSSCSCTHVDGVYIKKEKIDDEEDRMSVMPSGHEYQAGGAVPASTNQDNSPSESKKGGVSAELLLTLMREAGVLPKVSEKITQVSQKDKEELERIKAEITVTEKEMESNRKTLKQLDKEIAALTEKRNAVQSKQDLVYERNRKLTQDADELDKKLRCCENILKVVPNT